MTFSQHNLPSKIVKRVAKFIILTLATAIMFTFGCLITQGQDLTSANLAYESGDYNTAIILYESALAVGDVSGELYYNAGNAYYLNGEMGRAMRYYLVAEIYLPRNRQLQSQIDLIRSQRVDGDLIETEPLMIAYDLTADYLTVTETAIFAFVLWVLFFLVMAIGMRRKGWSVLIGLFGIVMLIGVGLLSIRVYVETQRPAAVILSESVQAMSGPGENFLPLFALYEGLDLRVLEERDGWLRFALQDGRQGWISSTQAAYIPNGFG